MDESEPNVGYMAGNAAKLARGGLGIAQALILVTLHTYELPLAMLRPKELTRVFSA